MHIPDIIAGRFRIESEIGRGGMGTVYRATHLGLGRAVAVKVIKPEFAEDPRVADRFMREARTMARLRHARAAMIFDAGKLRDGRCFIVMEFVEGKTLSEVLATEGRFTSRRAVSVASEICDVLAEAHALGIIHRDLKPSNIMLNERGVCVLDFGVAKVLQTPTETTGPHLSTDSGQVVGTPRYMSPEQCLGQRVGVRSDLYSLGLLIYEMLAGRPPFVDALPSAVMVKQATEPPPPLPRLRADVPRPLALAVHTLLAKRPEDRPRNALAARTMLEESLTRVELRKQPSEVRAGLVPARQAQDPNREAAPFAITVAALQAKRNLLVRLAVPAALIVAIGALLLAWGYKQRMAQDLSPKGGEPNKEGAASVSLSRAQPRLVAAKAAARNSVLPATAVKSSSATSMDSSPISLDDARRLARSVSPHGSIGDVFVVPTGRSYAIVAFHNERARGTSHLFVMEPRNKEARSTGARSASYRITAHVPLDVSDFRGAKWQVEALDADGIGPAVVFIGTNARCPSSNDQRLVLYVPRTRRVYAMRVKGGTGGQPSRISWSANTQTRRAEVYRNVLRQRSSYQ